KTASGARKRSKTGTGTAGTRKGTKSGRLDPGTAKPKTQADVERKRALQAQQAEIDRVMKKKQMMMYAGITIGTILLAIIIFAIKDRQAAPAPPAPAPVVDSPSSAPAGGSTKPPSAAGSIALRRVTKDANALVQAKDFAGAIGLYESFITKRPDEAESAQAKIDYIVNTFLGGKAPTADDPGPDAGPATASAAQGDWTEVAQQAAKLHGTGDPEKFMEAINMLAAYRDTHSLDRAKADGLIAKLGRFYFEKTGKFPVLPEAGSTVEEPDEPPRKKRKNPKTEIEPPPAEDFDLPPGDAFDDLPPAPSEAVDDLPPAPSEAVDDLPPAPDDVPAAPAAKSDELDFDLPPDFDDPPAPPAE
ncbi:MAG: hypothetical protein ACI8W8_002632, partial [Rhodothermales bacterium]